MYFKDLQNKLYFLDDAKDAGYLPAGCIEITQAQASAINAPLPKTAADVWELIKRERDRRSELGGYKVGLKWFHSDSKSKTQQLGLVIAGAGLPAGLQWKTMDGSFIAMTPTLAGQIFQAAMQSDAAIFTVAETHKANSQTSPDTYNYLTGWPVGYGE